MAEIINEPIKVLVEFDRGRLTPRLFTWRNRDYSVRRVEFVHSVREKGDRVYRFSVTGSGAGYHLTFNSRALTWRLSAIETTGAR